METLYLKYRPKKFSDIVWQEHVKKLFSNALSKGMVSHSYIFSGPRGTGKTSTARILAKSLNCENPIDGYEPCNECTSCKTIDSGKSMDVVEMDAASNRGIDEIRAIRDKVAYLPVESKYKVYIIDEVHMLTKEAFNALLKTLEEPPEHTVFILATTEIQKVPETVKSRCQVVEFRRIPEESTKKHLIEICKNENIGFEMSALDHIAKRSTGGLRDAIGLLEEVSRFSSGDVTLNETLSMLGEVSAEMVEEYVSSIIKGNAELLLKLIDTIEEQGVEPLNFARQSLEFVSVKLLEPSMVEVGKFISDLVQRLKYEERQFDTFKVLSIFESMKHTETFSRSSEVIEKAESSNIKEINPDSKKSDIKTDVERLIEWYSTEGEISIFACLAKSSIKDFGDRVLAISDSELCHEFLKEGLKDIEGNFKRLTSREVKFLSAYSAVSIETMEPKMRDAVIRTLSIFGGKLLPEGGEEIV